MNLDELLNVTKPVSVTFMDHEFTAHVYTAGQERLSVEDVEALVPTDEERESHQEGKLYNAHYMRRAIPVMVSTIEQDGEPMEWGGQLFPENVKLLPFRLLTDLGSKILGVWNKANPTDGEVEQSGLQPEAQLESAQIESIGA